MKVPSEDFFSKRDQISKKQFLCSVSLEYVVNTMLTPCNMGNMGNLFISQTRPQIQNFLVNLCNVPRRLS